ncbi:MAG TPA: type 1 glutamine amidotransferase [Geminicoccaceae bacterium]|nr:type 1 glutamine amidotransferase [Geminicoccaceae bacterium]
MRRQAQPRILVLQHMSLAHAGIFRACMRAAGMAWDVVALEAGEPIPTLADYDALLVMGGAMDVWQEAQHPWLRAEKQAIRAAVLEHGMAYLGICLGHQLLAAALGGEVREAATPEVGIREVRLNAAGRSSPLFEGLPERSRWLQWHAAEVVTPPAGAEVLAYSDACAVQALAVGERAFGLQFHAEVDLPTLADWLSDAETRAALVRHRGADGPERLRAEAAAAMPALEGAARQIFDNFRALL